MEFVPVVLVHPIGGEHEVDTAERLESFLKAGWVPKPIQQTETEKPVKQARSRKQKGD